MPHPDSFVNIYNTKTPWLAMQDGAHKYRAYDAATAQDMFNTNWGYAVDAYVDISAISPNPESGSWGNVTKYVIGGYNWDSIKRTYDEILFYHEWVFSFTGIFDLSGIIGVSTRIDVYDLDAKGTRKSDNSMWVWTSGSSDNPAPSPLTDELYWFNDNWYGQGDVMLIPNDKQLRLCFGTPGLASSQSYKSTWEDSPKGIDPNRFGICARTMALSGEVDFNNSYMLFYNLLDLPPNAGKRLNPLNESTPAIYINARVTQQAIPKTYVYLHHDRKTAKNQVIVSGLNKQAELYICDTTKDSVLLTRNTEGVDENTILANGLYTGVEYAILPSGITYMFWLDTGKLKVVRVDKPYSDHIFVGDIITLADNTGVSIGEPTVLVTKDMIWCFYWEGDTTGKAGAIMARVSTDEGKTWCDPAAFFPSIKYYPDTEFFAKHKVDVKESASGNLILAYVPDTTKPPVLQTVKYDVNTYTVKATQ